MAGIIKRLIRSLLRPNCQDTGYVNKVVSIKKTPSFNGKFLAGEHKNKVELI